MICHLHDKRSVNVDGVNHLTVVAGEQACSVLLVKVVQVLIESHLQLMNCVERASHRGARVVRYSSSVVIMGANLA